MGTVQQTFTTDITDVENKLAKLQAAHNKLKEKIAETGRESRQSSHESAAGISRMTGSIGELVPRVTLAAAAFGAVSDSVKRLVSGYDEWIKKIAEAARAQGKLSQDAIQTMVGLGMVAEAPRIEKWIAGAGARGTTREQAQAALAGAAGATPTSSIERRLELAEQAGRMAPVLRTPEAVGEYARSLGTLAEPWQGKSVGDVADVMEAVRKRTGADFAKIATREFMGGAIALQKSGAASVEQSLALGSEMVRMQMSPETVQQLAAKIAAPMSEKPRQWGEAAKPEDEAYNRFARASASERFRLALSDTEVQKSVLGAEVAGKMAGRITLESVNRGAAELVEAQRSDLAERVRAQALGTEGGRRASRGQQAAVSEEGALASLATVSLDRERLKKYTDMRRAQETAAGRMTSFQAASVTAGLEYWQEHAKTAGGFGAGDTTNALIVQRAMGNEEALRYLREVEGLNTAGVEVRQNWLGQRSVERDGQRIASFDEFFQDPAKFLRGQPDPQMDQQTALLTEIRDRLPGGPSAPSAGQAADAAARSGRE